MDDKTLEQTVALLKERDATIAQQQQTIDQLQDLLKALTKEIELFKRSLFGRRRERFDDPRQEFLFESQLLGETDKADDEAPSEDQSEQPTRRRSKGRGKRVFPSALPRRKVVRQLNDEDIPEHLRGKEGVRRFLKLAGEWIESEPASMYVVQEYVEVLAADNQDATETNVLTASREPRILDCFAGPSLLAGLAVDHFADHLPYYREEERLLRQGVSIPRSTICRWMIRLAEPLSRLVDPMRQAALQSTVICVDETPVKMLDPDLPHAATTYLWAVVGDAAHPYTTFHFTENRSRAGPEKFLSGFEGVLLSDAYVCYESLQAEWSDHMQWACCHAHARRKFEELHHLGATRQTSTALGYFQRLFDIEDRVRDLTDDARLAVRQAESRPLLSEFKDWMEGQLQRLRPKHELRGAINYMIKRWDSFTRFLESGAIPIDNNSAERAVKLPVIGKKNYLFFGSPQGGGAAMVFYTLTATCRRLHIDPRAYLADVFIRLPKLAEDEIECLLPDRWLAEHPQHRLEHRVAEAHNRARRKSASRSKRRKALQRAQMGR